MDPVVTVCTGHRCAALLGSEAETACEHGLEQLRPAVRASSDVVLVSTGCLGPCAQAPVVVVSEGVRDHERLQLGRSRWLGPVGGPVLDELCGWIEEGAPEALPEQLASARFAGAPS